MPILFNYWYWKKLTISYWE